MYSILNTVSNIAHSVQKDEYVKVDKKQQLQDNQSIGIKGSRS